MKTVLFLAAVSSALYVLSGAPPATEQIGPLPNGGFLLGTGSRLRPLGKQVPLGSMPMSSALSKDGKYLLILNAGLAPPSITTLRADTLEVVGSTPLQDGWLGLTFSPDGKFVYVGGASQACVYELSFQNGKLQPTRTFPIVAAQSRTTNDFMGDVTVSPDGRLIYVAGLFDNSIHVINPQSGRVIEKWRTGRRPYRILFHPDGKSYFVTSWSDGSIYHHNAATGEQLQVLRLASHPTDMVFRARKPEEKEAEQARWPLRLFVTAANTNNVYSVGVTESKELQTLESVNLSTSAHQPIGITPSGLALSSDQSRLYVTCSDANALAVVDISDVRSTVMGFVGTGWYPTAARSLPNGKLIVLNGRGGPPIVKNALQAGSATIIDSLTDTQLDKYTENVLENSLYRDEPASAAPATAGPSPIEHVVYIVKGSRSYDQVLGDLDRGNGERSLAQFGERTSPNHHKLAREFALLDNFYSLGDSPEEGYSWATSAIVPDFVQKLSPSHSAGRLNSYDFESGESTALPPAGRLWNNAAAAGISVQNYGWWVVNQPRGATGSSQIASVRDPALAKITNPAYRGLDFDYPDTARANAFLADLQSFEKTGAMPQLSLLRLSNSGLPKPAKDQAGSAMADHDYALGQIVEALSHSKFWGTTAIFVTEAYAGSDADHVNPHRTAALVISPYTRGAAVDSAMYNSASMLRTIELMVGLRPMTIYDAGARVISSAFGTKADPQPYVAIKPNAALRNYNYTDAVTAAALSRSDFRSHLPR